MRVREVIREIERDGWYIVRQRGSHRHYRHTSKPGIVTVAGKPSTEVPRKTLASIRRLPDRGPWTMSRYLVVIEEGPSSFGAYSPDLPGCVAVGDTREETEQLMREAIEAHVEELRAGGDLVPKPSTSAAYVEV